MLCFLQDFLRSDSEEKHFKNFAYFGITADIHLYALQLVKVSTGQQVFSWKRPVSASIRVPRRQYLFEICLVENSAQKLPSDCHFLYFHFFQASLQLVPARSLNVVLYLIGSDLQV